MSKVVERKDEYVHELFNSIADHYDAMNMFMTGGLWKYWQYRFTKLLGDISGKQVLDVACGTGDLSLIMAKRVNDGTITSLDFAEEMLAVAERKIEQQGFSERVELIHGDAMALPLEDNSYDLATIGFALRNVADVSTVIGEMARTVKPGGRVISIELSKPKKMVIARPYYWYFENIVPLMGKWAQRRAKNLDIAPYAWLPESLKGFPDAEELAEIFRENGLTSVEYYPLTGGIVCLHVGTKQ